MNVVKHIRIVVLLSLFATQATAKPAPEGFADLVEQLMPSVVNISTSQTVELSNKPFSFLFRDFEGGENSPFSELPDMFEKFYGDREGNEGSGGTEQKTTALGSGFVLSSEGYIVTNNHVIEKADEITVIFSDESTAVAEIVGSDAKTDIALLKVKTDKKLVGVKWGDSDTVRVGDWVIAIGNPFGLGGSVSAGIISARARDINAGPFDDFLQTDAAINRGNSGGPLFNTKGEVVGINSAIFSPSGGSVGIGFSVPASLARPVIEQLKEHGRTYRGWLGVKIQTVTEDIAESLGLSEAKGALVLEVTPGSPAEKAGIVSGDVVTEFDGKDVPTMRKLPRIVAETEVGKKVAVVVWRKGKKTPLAVEIAELDEKADEAEEDAALTATEDQKDDLLANSMEILSMHVAPLTEKLRKRFKVEDATQGVVIVKIAQDGDAAGKGLVRGDVIEAINQEKTAKPEDAVAIVEKAVKAGRKSVLLLVNRRGNAQFIALSVEKK